MIASEAMLASKKKTCCPPGTCDNCRRCCGKCCCYMFILFIGWFGVMYVFNATIHLSPEPDDTISFRAAVNGFIMPFADFNATVRHQPSMG